MKALIVLSVFISQFSISGFAADENGKHPCAADIAKFCEGVKPGKGGIARCLKEHEKDLSESCKAQGQKIKERFQEARDACKGDVEKFCADVKPGKGNIIRCLKEHENELSDACKSVHKRRK